MMRPIQIELTDSPTGYVVRWPWWNSLSATGATVQEAFTNFGAVMEKYVEINGVDHLTDAQVERDKE